MPYFFNILYTCGKTRGNFSGFTIKSSTKGAVLLPPTLLRSKAKLSRLMVQYFSAFPSSCNKCIVTPCISFKTLSSSFILSSASFSVSCANSTSTTISAIAINFSCAQASGKNCKANLNKLPPACAEASAGRPDCAEASAGRPDCAEASAGRPDCAEASAGRPDCELRSGRPFAFFAIAGKKRKAKAKVESSKVSRLSGSSGKTLSTICGNESSLRKYNIPNLVYFFSLTKLNFASVIIPNVPCEPLNNCVKSKFSLL